MKLHQVPRKTWVQRIDGGDHMDIFFYDRPDGTYCLGKDLNGILCRYPMSCEVEELPEHLFIYHNGKLIDPRNLNFKTPT